MDLLVPALTTMACLTLCMVLWSTERELARLRARIAALETAACPVCHPHPEAEEKECRMARDLCDVCGALAPLGTTLATRAGRLLCAECALADRRYNAETGALIERRGDSWVEISHTFVAPQCRPAERS